MLVLRHILLKRIDMQHLKDRLDLVYRPMKNTLSGNEGRGFMKILVDAKTDAVIGVHMIGPDCAEIMQVSFASSVLADFALCLHLLAM